MGRKKVDREEFAKYYNDHPDADQNELARKFKVQQPCISRILKSMDPEKKKEILSKKFLYKKMTLEELLVQSSVYSHTQIIFIKMEYSKIDQMISKLHAYYKNQGDLEIIEMIPRPAGLVVISTDLLIGEKLNKIKSEQIRKNATSTKTNSGEQSENTSSIESNNDEQSEDS